MFALSHTIDLSVVPFNVIPPPSAVVSDGVATLPISMFLSSTVKVVEFIVVVVPFTVKSPATVRFLTPVRSLFESTISAFDAVAVPAVAPNKLVFEATSVLFDTSVSKLTSVATPDELPLQIFPFAMFGISLERPLPPTCMIPDEASSLNTLPIF